MINFLKSLFRDEDGATMTEYIILVVLIAIAAIVVVTQFGDEIKRLFTKSTGELKKL